VLLGGRAAEQLVFGELSTGAADDLAKVTDIARSIVTQYGMDEKLGNVVFERQRSAFLGPAAPEPWYERSFSEETSREIDCAIRRLVKDAFEKASQILQQRRRVLERCAQILLERETLSESELNELTALEPALPFPAVST
jgi:cell division protease FtsH